MATFSYKKGKALCKINGGTEDGRTIYLYDKDYKCCLECCDKCKYKKCCKKCSVVNYHEKINPEYIEQAIKEYNKNWVVFPSAFFNTEWQLNRPITPFIIDKYSNELFNELF